MKLCVSLKSTWQFERAWTNQMDTLDTSGPLHEHKQEIHANNAQTESNHLLETQTLMFFMFFNNFPDYEQMFQKRKMDIPLDSS